LALVGPATTVLEKMVWWTLARETAAIPKRAARAEPDLVRAKEEFRAALHSYKRSYNQLHKWFVDLGHGQNNLMTF
jgi:hypothetical protein